MASAMHHIPCYRTPKKGQLKQHIRFFILIPRETLLTSCQLSRACFPFTEQSSFYVASFRSSMCRSICDFSHCYYWLENVPVCSSLTKSIARHNSPSYTACLSKSFRGFLSLCREFTYPLILRHMDTRPP